MEMTFTRQQYDQAINEQRAKTCHGTVHYNFGLEIKSKTCYWFLGNGVYIGFDDLNTLVMFQNTITIHQSNVLQADLGPTEVGYRIVEPGETWPTQ